MVTQKTEIGTAVKTKQKLSKFEEAKRRYEAQQEELAKIEELQRLDEEDENKEKMAEMQQVSSTK
jgi:hypothetical protein